MTNDTIPTPKHTINAPKWVPTKTVEMQILETLQRIEKLLAAQQQSQRDKHGRK